MKTELQEKGPSAVHCRQRERGGLFLTYPINAKPNFLTKSHKQQGQAYDRSRMLQKLLHTDTYRHFVMSTRFVNFLFFANL